MEEIAGTSVDQGEMETEKPEKVYGKAGEEEPVDKVVAANKKFRYQILTLPEIDDTLSKLLGTMVFVSFQTMLQASPRLLKGLRQLLTCRRVEVEEAPEPQEQEMEELQAPQGVFNLQRIPGDLEDLEKAFADIRLSLPDREGGEVMRAPPGTKLSFHALPVEELKIQIGTHHTVALVDGGAKITLIRRDFVTITGCTVNKEVTGSIRGAGGEIPFAGYVTKCAVRAGIRESIWSFQRMTMMEEMNHDIILGRPWCANVEMIGMHLHDGTYMVDIEDPVTGRGELLRLLGTGGDPPKGKLTTWSPTFEESARKGAFAQMEERQFKKEILAILHCLKTFQPYLFGRRFIQRIDPTNVVGALKNYKPIDPTIGRWIGFIWQFDYKVERIAGLRNRADGLSRVCITPEGVEDTEPIDAFLEYEGGTLAVDNEMAGATPTMDQLLIQTLEKGPPAVIAELREGPVTTIKRKDEKDSWGYIFDARDNLGGYVEAVTLKRKTGKGVADWVEDFYLRHSFVRRFIADNGTEFVNQEVLGKLKTLCVPIKIIEPYHPEANAPVERGHRTLKNTIAKLEADDLGNWSRYLKQAVFSENMMLKRTTGCIPTELWYGREIDFPVEALVPTWNRLDDNPHMSTEELIAAHCQQVVGNEEALEEVVKRVMDSRMRDKARWDQVKNIRKEPLQVGEKVLVRNSALESTWFGQLGRRFKGPYKITKRVGLNTFELEDLGGTGMKGSFPWQRLVRFLSKDPVEQ
ncbi:hypothetical protein CBR_g30646 [Chara braunii]|uniref:Integrase catalytic domain-containing protein n=1 Tax=Chara braunii TaxID=69332 RepID=A0A388LD98_CHABU|nr:hypothetical protein CBR_g30646 [Chara braunii]|eukprot:GBG80279.1 hypothetical protein CBR_g30646 [Chara braunii]